MGKYSKGKKAAIYAALVIFVIIALFPILYPLMSSFRTDQEIFQYTAPFNLHTLIPVDWTMENYISLFRDHGFGQYIKNTLIVVGITVPVSILSAPLPLLRLPF